MLLLWRRNRRQGTQVSQSGHSGASRRWPWTALLGLSLLSASGCYVSRLGYHQAKLLNSRRPVPEVMADPATSPATRQRLGWVADVLAFAKKEGMHSEGAYTRYIDLEGKAVSYLVQAAYPDRLEARTWWFPIVGDVPYLGFFSERERDEEAATLAAEGFDISKGEAAAFSSLGWFEDPLYSSMLERSREGLASLLFHELCHRTLWIADYAEFSENLATFVEGELTRRFLRSQGDLAGIERYNERLADKALYKSWLSALKKSLEDLYRSPPAGGKTRLFEKKAEIFARFTRDLRPSFARTDYVGKRPWNNATVMGASLYSPDASRFKAAFRCYETKPIGSFLAAIAARWAQDEPHGKDPFAAIEKLCKTS